MVVKSSPGFFATRSRMAKPRVKAGTTVSLLAFRDVIIATGVPGSAVPSIFSPLPRSRSFLRLLFINLNKSSVLDPPYHVKKMHAMEKALSFSGKFRCAAQKRGRVRAACRRARDMVYGSTNRIRGSTMTEKRDVQHRLDEAASACAREGAQLTELRRAVLGL